MNPPGGPEGEYRRHSNAFATVWLRNERGRVGNDAHGVLGRLRRMAWLPDSKALAIAARSGVAVVVVEVPSAAAPSN